MVAHVQQLVKCKALLADGVQADIDLQPLAALLQGSESSLALGADGHDAPGNGNRDALGLEVLGLRIAPLGAHRGNGVRGGELVGIGRLAQLLDFFQFRLAQVEEIALKFRIEHVDSFRVNWFIVPAGTNWNAQKSKSNRRSFDSLCPLRRTSVAQDDSSLAIPEMCVGAAGPKGKYTRSQLGPVC